MVNSQLTIHNFVHFYRYRQFFVDVKT